MKKIKFITLSAVLTSIALALSYLERFIPLQAFLPLPGVKLGLGNIVSLVALYVVGFRAAYVILVLRCMIVSFLSGSITGFLFSITGGTLAMCVMFMAMRMPFLSVYGVSILGAAAHNIGQIIISMILMNSFHIGIYLSYLLMIALFTGTLTGLLASGIIKAVYNANISI